MVHLGMDRRGLVQYSRDLMLCSDMYKKRLDWISSGKSLFTWYMYTSYPTPSLTPPQTILPTPLLPSPLHKPSFLPHSFLSSSTNHPSLPHSFLSSSPHPSPYPPLIPPSHCCRQQTLVWVHPAWSSSIPSGHIIINCQPLTRSS